jgi:hypothetical protein
MELLMLVAALFAPGVITLIAAQRDRKHQWRGWSS